jgi:YihY family inner membrane protein
MSTASTIPETWDLDGDDARRTLERTGRLRLLRDAFARLRWSDGFSHARSIAFLLALLFIEGVIALVGLASVLGSGGLGEGIVRGLQTAVPGPAGRVLTEAVTQAHQAGTGSRFVALVAGSIAAVVTGTTLLGQFERAINRIYGVEQDRPTLRKYGNAFVLLCTAGLLAVLGFACVALGHVIGTAFHNDLWTTVWNVARWPVGVLFITGAVVLILQRAPRRHQPGWSWLSLGALLAVVLWIAVTAAFDVFFSVSSTFGQTYGPLAGIVALLLWSFGSAVAVLYGVSVAAQLEAVRAGVPAPQQMERTIATEPRPDRQPVAVADR